MKNFERAIVPPSDEGHFFRTKSGCQLYVYEYQADQNYQTSIFIISGITGINHNATREMVEVLSNGKNRVLVIHPRGTGYSEGKRGDISNFSDFVNDYVEFIESDKDYRLGHHPVLLFGHSMSTAVLLAVANKLDHVRGAILVNPPYILKKAKGMSPGVSQYLKYVWFYLFQRHTPIVDMAGDPELIENEEDRMDSQERISDPLLVRYFSMYVMTQSRKLMKSMIGYCRSADYHLLLVYGEKDSIVDKKGCDLLFEAWKSENKKYVLVKEGTHGNSTVRLATDAIRHWIASFEQGKKEY